MEEATSSRRCTWPLSYSSKTSTATHNAVMREIIKPWASVPLAPASCQPVMYSSWSRFSPDTGHSKPEEEMKVSKLWAPQGVTSEYNPPISEWTYLGVEQFELVACEATNGQRTPNRHRRQAGSSNSWLTASSSSDSNTKSNPITFEKVPVKGTSTSSLLTASFESVPAASPQARPSPIGALVRSIGNVRLDVSMLPSAFDSDSEDEDD